MAGGEEGERGMGALSRNEFEKKKKIVKVIVLFSAQQHKNNKNIQRRKHKWKNGNITKQSSTRACNPPK